MERRRSRSSLDVASELPPTCPSAIASVCSQRQHEHAVDSRLHTATGATRLAPQGDTQLCCPSSRSSDHGNIQQPAQVDAEGKSCRKHRSKQECRLSKRRGCLTVMRASTGKSLFHHTRFLANGSRTSTATLHTFSTLVPTHAMLLMRSLCLPQKNLRKGHGQSALAKSHLQSRPRRFYTGTLICLSTTTST